MYELIVIGNFIKSIKEWATVYRLTTIECNAIIALNAFNNLEATLTRIEKKLDEFEKIKGGQL